MSRAGYETADRENTFGLAFPQKRAVELWFADEWGPLVTGIDELRRNHRYRKCDRNRIALGNFSARGLDDDAAGIRFCIRLFLFRVFIGIRSRHGTGLVEWEAAICEQQDCY